MPLPMTFEPQSHRDALRAQVPELYRTTEITLSGDPRPGGTEATLIPAAIQWRWDSPAGQVVSVQPVEVHVQQEGELFHASNEELAVHAGGRTREEAIRDFAEQLIHFERYYRSLREDQVTGMALRLKRLYCTLFERPARSCR